MNPVQQLAQSAQAVWFDFIRRHLLTGGELNRMVERDALRGITANPSIFEKAIVVLSALRHTFGGHVERPAGR